MHGHSKHLEWSVHYPTYAIRIGGALEWNRAYQTVELHVYCGPFTLQLIADYRTHEWGMGEYMIAADVYGERRKG